MSFIDWVKNPGAKLREAVGTDTEEDRKALNLKPKSGTNALIESKYKKASGESDDYRDGKDAGELGKKYEDIGK
jgi:hypothetical protein